MIVIIDDVFSNEDLQEFISVNNEFIEKKYPHYNDFFTLDKEVPMQKFAKTILEHAGKYFDLSDMKEYEYWSHKNTRPSNIHFDKDEIIYEETGELVYPICSTVFYPIEDKNLQGGKLIIEDHVRITPKANRLVVFRPGILHHVELFRGRRTSININPWRHR